MHNLDIDVNVDDLLFWGFLCVQDSLPLFIVGNLMFVD